VITGKSSPAWRKAFDGIERRIGRPLEAATNSPDLQNLIISLNRVRRTVSGPAEHVASWGLHRVGLPSRADVQAMSRQLNELQRDISALHRQLASAERAQRPKR
jgi:hypothetical protein